VSAAAPPVEASGSVDAGVGQVRRELLHELLKSKSFLIGAVIVLFWVLCALLGGVFAPHDPLAQNLLGVNKRPSGAHVFGTDQLGRDVLSRVIVGARTDEQLADNLAAATLELTQEEHQRLEAVSRPPLIYPFWHQRASASERLSDADLSLIGPHLLG